jgi:hypothetical protein
LARPVSEVLVAVLLYTRVSPVNEEFVASYSSYAVSVPVAAPQLMVNVPLLLDVGTVMLGGAPGGTVTTRELAPVR